MPSEARLQFFISSYNYMQTHLPNTTETIILDSLFSIHAKKNSIYLSMFMRNNAVVAAKDDIIKL